MGTSQNLRTLAPQEPGVDIGWVIATNRQLSSKGLFGSYEVMNYTVKYRVHSCVHSTWLQMHIYVIKNDYDCTPDGTTVCS